VERAIGTVRRVRLDQLMVFNENSFYRHLKSFVTCYHRSRTHLLLGKDKPEPRPVQPPVVGEVVASPEVGGPYNRYERRAA
jgi:hypothetical protein